MILRRWTLPIVVLAVAPATTFAQSLISSDEADQIGMQVFWQATAPLPVGEVARSAQIVDDNIYLMTPSNIAIAVHAGTGVTRWVSRIADPDQTVRGPTHSDRYAFFTRPASVRVLDRRTGLPATQPRKLRGVIIIVEHDTAEISLGQAHGLRLDHVLDVISAGDAARGDAEPIAQLKISVVGDRKSKGQLIRSSRTDAIRPGDVVRADIELPLESVKLPFAASSPTVGDDEDMFVGAANQRMYSLRVLTGFENWRVLTPQTMTAPAALYGDSVYFCDQDGRAASATKRRRERNWEFYTEGAIFLPPVVTKDYVFVASSDRSLYCLQRDEIDGSPRRPGERVWQRRFDEPPEQAPVIVDDLLFHRTTDGLHAVKVEDGEEVWSRPGTAQFLTRVGDDVYVAESSPMRIVRLKTKTGEEVAAHSEPGADFILASAENQLVVLGNRLGRLACLRPSKAPFLRTEQLAMVLQNDRKARELSTLLAQEKAKREAASKAKAEAERPRERKHYSFLEEDNWLVSSSDRPAVGTREFAKKPVKAAAEKPAAKPAEESKKAGEKKAEKKEDDDWGDDWGDDDAGKKDDDKKADNGGDSDDDGKSGGGDDSGDDGGDDDDDW